MVVSKNAHQRYTRTTKASVRTPWRHRRKRVAIIRTPAEKAAIKAKNHERKVAYAGALSHAQDVVMQEAIKLREQFGSRSVEYYFEAILQTSRLTKKRGPNRWNVYLRQEVKKHNDNLNDGQKRVKATDLERNIASVWNSMTPDEKDAATEDAMKDLREHRENKALATHNIPTSSFHDSRVTLDTISHELSNLSARTGQKTILISVRGDMEHLQRPFVYVTDEVMADYFHTLTKATIVHFAARFEALCIAGVSGLVSNYKESFLALKKETASLILQKLSEAAQTPVSKMFYTNFDSQITAKYGVIVVNWPLKVFSSPSDIGLMTELKVLYNAWKTRTTTFRKPTPAEWEDWEATRFNARMAKSQADVDLQPQTDYSIVQSMTASPCLPSGSSQSPLPTPAPSLQSDGHGTGPTFASFRLSATQTASARVVTDATTVSGMDGQCYESCLSDTVRLD
ncbi:hypothetical protein EDD15DRAFT_2177067 [Pisolithus albus]|nr:hypothetical protein EDD15DRAFT_2177067 [Pisolithus albus]